MDDAKILKAGVIGALSTSLSELVSWLLLFFGIGKYSVYQLNSLIVTISRTSEIIGLIINFLVGSIISSIIYLVFKKWGHRYIVINCIMVGLMTWLLWEFLFTLSIEGKTIGIRPIADYYNHLLGTFVYGASMGILLKLFIFKTENMMVSK